MSSDNRVFCPFCLAELSKADNYLDEKTKEIVIVGYCDSCKSKCELDRIKDYSAYEILWKNKISKYGKKLKPASRYSPNPNPITKF